MNDPKNIRHWVWRVVWTLVVSVIAKAILGALAERHIHPDLWLTRGIDGAATLASTATQVTAWLLAGAAGLVGLVLFELLLWPLLERRAQAKPSPAQPVPQNFEVMRQSPEATIPLAPNPGARRDIDPNALLLSVGESGPYFRTNSRSSYQLRRTLNVKLENTDDRTAVTGAKIQVMRVDPEEYRGPWELTETFSLAAGDHLFVPLVEYGEATSVSGNPSGDSFMCVLTRGTIQPKPDAKSHHVITLKAVSMETAPVWLQCRIWIDGAGRLRIAGDQIALNKAAEQAFAELQGTIFGDEIERVGGSTEEILKTVMFNISKRGEVTGVRWPAKTRGPVPDFGKFVISPGENCLRYTHGDRPVYTELTTTLEAVDEFVRYGKSVSQKI